LLSVVHPTTLLPTYHPFVVVGDGGDSGEGKSSFVHHHPP
jgi:hypothetical protein